MRIYWGGRQKLYPGYFFVNPILNQSSKWRFDYIIVNHDKSCLWHKFPRYFVKVSQLNGSFFVLVKRSRGKILGENRRFFFDTVQRLSEDIYKNYARNCSEFSHNYFLYFKLVKCYGNCHYHFLVVKKDYCYGW